MKRGQYEIKNFSETNLKPHTVQNRARSSTDNANQYGFQFFLCHCGNKYMMSDKIASKCSSTVTLCCCHHLSSNLPLQKKKNSWVWKLFKYCFLFVMIILFRKYIVMTIAFTLITTLQIVSGIAEVGINF